MSTTTSAKPLAEALAAVLPVVRKSGPVRAGNVQLSHQHDHLVVAAQSANRAVQLEYRLPGIAGTPWTAALQAEDADRLAKSLKAISKTSKTNGNSQVELLREATTLVVTGGGQRLVLPAAELDELPEQLPVTETGIDEPSLTRAITEAMAFCESDPYRELTRGVHLYLRQAGEQLQVPALVATDGHRLYLDGDHLACSEGSEVLRVESERWKTLSKALPSLPTRLALQRESVPVSGDLTKPPEPASTWLVIEGPERRLRLRLEPEATALPRWSSFLPEIRHPHLQVTCDRLELVEAAKAVGTITRDRKAACMLRTLAAEGRLRLRMVDSEGGMVERQLPAGIVVSSGRTLHVNVRYLLDALEVVRTDVVHLVQEDSPLGSIRVLEDGVAGRPRGIVVMPVRGGDEREETAPVEVPTGLTSDEPFAEPDAYEHDSDQQPEHGVAV